MKYNFIKSIAVAVAISASLSSCINDDDYGVPALNCTDPGLTANKTVAQVKATATANYMKYTADDIIEAYVTSSDERGNFFKAVYAQTKPTDGSAPVGFVINIDKNSLFGDGFYPGRKIYVKLKDLYYMIDSNTLSIGDLYSTNGLSFDDPAAELDFGRIPEYKYANYIKPSCDEVNEEDLVRYISLTQALNDANLGTLIEIQNVQFSDEEVGQTYYDANSANTAGGATNRYLTDIAGATVAFRTSSYANFSGNVISAKSGSIRGVLTKYGSDYQFMARSEDDIKLTNDVRLDPAPPIVGANLSITGAYNETFESYAVGATTFPTAINDAAVGTSYWNVKTFSGNKYLYFSSYNNASASNRVLFIVPKSATATTLQFQTLAGYSNGNPLKVYYSADYTPGSDINDATLQDITSNFSISVGPASAYATTFTNSGVYSFTAGQQGFFIFEYIGSDANGITTNLELDNIKVQ